MNNLEHNPALPSKNASLDEPEKKGTIADVATLYALGLLGVMATATPGCIAFEAYGFYCDWTGPSVVHSSVDK